MENSNMSEDEPSRVVDPNGHESDQLLPQPPGSLDSTQILRKRMLIFAFPTLVLCEFAIGFDSSYMVGNYARRIAVDLHDFKNAKWLVLGSLVAEATFCPLYGHAAQIYGHRKALLFATTAMSVGLLLCYRIWQAALARAVVAMGSIGIELLVVVIMNELVPLHELPLWTGASFCFSTAGLMFGGPAGAALTDHLGFRPTFGFELCGLVVTTAVAYFTLRLPPVEDKTSAQAAKRLEYPSAFLLLVSIAAPLFAINLGGEIFEWTHPVIIALFGITPAFIALLSYSETHFAATPIMPRRFIRNRNIAIALACTLPMKFVVSQMLFSFGTYLEARSFHNGSSFSDWALTCIYLGRSIGNILCGILIKRYRKFKGFLQLNILVDIILFTCFAVGWIRPEQPVFAPLLVFLGAVPGFAEGLWLVALLPLVDVEDQSLLYSFFVLALAIAGDLGAAISLAVEGAFVRIGLNAKLCVYPNAEEIIRKSLEDLNYIRQLPFEIQKSILDALTSSIELAFGISCFVLAISLIASFFIKDMSGSTRKIPHIP